MVHFELEHKDMKRWGKYNFNNFEVRRRFIIFIRFKKKIIFIQNLHSICS